MSVFRFLNNGNVTRVRNRFGGFERSRCPESIRVDNRAARRRALRDELRFLDIGGSMPTDSDFHCAASCRGSERICPVTGLVIDHASGEIELENGQTLVVRFGANGRMTSASTF